MSIVAVAAIFKRTRNRQTPGLVNLPRRSWLIKAAWFFLLFGLAMPSGAAAGRSGNSASDRWLGQPVRKIEVVPPESLTPNELKAVIKIQPGDSYSPAALRTSVQNLYLTEKYHQVEARLSAYADGVKITLLLSPKLRLKAIKFSGLTFFNRDEMKKIMGAETDKEYIPADRERYREKILAAYREQGYFETQVEIEPHTYPDQRLDLLVKINEASPYTIANIGFTGHPILSSDYLLHRIDSQPGEILSAQALKKDREKLLKIYRENNFLDVEVGEPEIITRPAKRQGDVQLPIFAGLQTQIVFQGGKGYSQRRLLKAAGLKNEYRLSALKLNSAAVKLTAWLKQQGYYYAQVNYRETNDPKKFLHTISFPIALGTRVHVREILFIGNEKISTALIRKQMLTGKRSPISWGYLDPVKFAKDLKAISYLYQRNGYLDAAVSEKIIRPEEDNYLIVEIQIQEGAQTRVESVTLIGAEPDTDLELYKLLGLRQGEPFNPWQVEEDKIKIQEYYARKGYIYARVENDLGFSADRGKVWATYRVTPGAPVKVGQIIVQGNTFTRTNVIAREVKLRSGDPYVPQEVFKSQQRVYRLGLFRNVRLTPAHPETEEAERDLLLKVEERDSAALEIAPGYATEKGVSLLAELSHRNLMGTGRALILRGELYENEDRVSLSYLEPWIFSLPYNGRLDLIRHRQEKDYYDLFNYSSIFSLEHDFTDYLKGVLQYDLENNYISRTDPNVVLTGLDTGYARIATLGATLTLDTRDDPFNPRRGTLDNLRLDWAPAFVGSQVEYLRLSGNTNWYFPVLSKSAFGFTIRTGYTQALGQTEYLPINKRFFLGGRTTLRGFDFELVGPQSIDGSPIGGNILFNYILEYRFPLYWKIGAVVFQDGGNVWLKDSSLVAKDIRTSIGAGLRYLTPVGPLSLDYGVKLDRRAGEAHDAWYFTIGNVF